jgi:hypothetical protein
MDQEVLRVLQSQAVERMASLMPSQDDLTLVVIRGHLLVEEQLWSALKAHVHHPQAIEDAQLRFPQLLQIVKAVSAKPVPELVVAAALKLNALRNAFAHQLEPKKLQEKVDALVRPLEQPYAAVFSHFPATTVGRVRGSVSTIYGNILGYWSVHAAANAGGSDIVVAVRI